MQRKGYLAAGVLLTALSCAACAPAGEESNKKGLEAYEAGRYEEAVGLFTQAITQDGTVSAYYINRGQACYRMGEYAEALECYEAAIRMDGSLYYAYRGAGLASKELGRYEEALSYFGLAIDRQGDKDNTLVWEVLGYRAEVRARSGDYEGALSDYQRLIDNNYRKRDIYQLMGDVWLESGDITQTLLCYQECLNIDNRDYDGYLTMAEKLKEADAQEAYQVVLGAALEVEPRQPKDWYYRGRVYLELGDQDQAFSSFEQSYNKGCREAGYYLGYCYELQKNYEEAMRLYQEQLESFPEDAQLYNQMAVCLIRQEQYREAAVMIDKGLSLKDPDVQEELLWNECICYERAGDYQTAVVKLMEYLESYPTDSSAQKELLFLRGR